MEGRGSQTSATGGGIGETNAHPIGTELLHEGVAEAGLVVVGEGARRWGEGERSSPPGWWPPAAAVVMGKRRAAGYPRMAAWRWVAWWEEEEEGMGRAGWEVWHQRR